MGELSALIAPRKLVISNGEVDPIFPLSGAKKVFETVKSIYKKEGAEENCKLVVFPDKPHYFDKVSVFGSIKAFREGK